jgi:hypothetical protein
MFYKPNIDKLLKEKMKLENYCLDLEKNQEREMKTKKNML